MRWPFRRIVAVTNLSQAPQSDREVGNEHRSWYGTYTDKFSRRNRATQPSAPRPKLHANWFRRLTRVPDSLMRPLLPRPNNDVSGNIPPERIIIIRGDELGDMVLTLPLLHSIRQTWPRTHITVVGKQPATLLLQDSFVVDDVIVWRPMTRLGWTAIGQVRALDFARRHLRNVAYDIAVLPRWDVDAYQSRYLALGSSASQIIGFDPKDRESPWWERDESILMTATVPSDTECIHELERSEAMARALHLAPIDRTQLGRVLFAESHERLARTVTDRLQRSPRPLIAIALGAGAQARIWPAWRYAQVVAALEFSNPVATVLLGSAADQPLAQQFLRTYAPSDQVLDLTGKVDLKTVLAILATCQLYVGGDTGLMHMACSVGTPAIVVSCHPRSGSRSAVNSPVRFGPWDSSSSTVVQPNAAEKCCSDRCVASIPHCILGIDIATVAGAIDERLNSLTSECQT